MTKQFDFVGRRKVFIGISLAILLVGIVCNFIFGSGHGKFRCGFNIRKLCAVPARLMCLQNTQNSIVLAGFQRVERRILRVRVLHLRFIEQIGVHAV